MGMVRLRSAYSGFSALQRAENSSIVFPALPPLLVDRFSALQRAENSSIVDLLCFYYTTTQGFSALQRAENSSIKPQPAREIVIAEFQCSSASRKFLNEMINGREQRIGSFSALQRAENSSISRNTRTPIRTYVSVLFSEPKIPQSFRRVQPDAALQVSVLFSEPKIPQRIQRRARRCSVEVSVLFSEPKIPQNDPALVARQRYRFQCSSASRKFLNWVEIVHIAPVRAVSVLFSEPKIPQSAHRHTRARAGTGFSALQRAENSSICDPLPVFIVRRGFSALQRAENSSSDPAPGDEPPLSVSVLFSEPKIPQRRTPHRSARRSRFQCSSASRKFLNMYNLCAVRLRTRRFSALQRAENSSTDSRSGSVAHQRGFSALQRAENSSTCRT